MPTGKFSSISVLQLLSKPSQISDALGFTKGHPFRALLDETGFGNHPEMIRAMRRVGERVGEDTFERGGSGDAKPKSDRELFYPGSTKQQ